MTQPSMTQHTVVVASTMAVWGLIAFGLGMAWPDVGTFGALTLGVVGGSLGGIVADIRTTLQY